MDAEAPCNKLKKTVNSLATATPNLKMIKLLARTGIHMFTMEDFTENAPHKPVLNFLMGE